MSHVLSLRARAAVLMAPATLVLASASGASGAVEFRCFTDRVAYTGTVSRFATAADATSNLSPISGPHMLPNRDAPGPFNTPNRDVTINFRQSFPSFTDRNQLQTAWDYTTNNGNPNPNNTNTGYVQIADTNSSTDTSASASFGNFDGTFWTSYTLEVSGENASSGPDFTRLWHAPGIGGASNLTAADCLWYDLDVTFTGLQGLESVPGVITANNHPTGVTGTLSAVFLNVSTTDTSLNGYYRADFTFNMDSWSFAQMQGGTLGTPAYRSSVFAVVPAPASVAVLGLGGLLAARRRRS